MGRRLKGVIFGIDKVLAAEGSVNVNLRREIGRLVSFLLSKGVTPVVLANREWTEKSDTGEEKLLQSVLEREWGEFPWFVANRDNLPHKPTTEATNYVTNGASLLKT